MCKLCMYVHICTIVHVHIYYTCMYIYVHVHIYYTCMYMYVHTCNKHLCLVVYWFQLMKWRIWTLKYKSVLLVISFLTLSLPTMSWHFCVYVHVHTCTCNPVFMCLCTCTCVSVHTCMYMYMKIHAPSMLAIGVDKHTQQTNKKPQWLH